MEEMAHNNQCDLACMTEACDYDGGGGDCAMVQAFLTVSLHLACRGRRCGGRQFEARECLRA